MGSRLGHGDLDESPTDFARWQSGSDPFLGSGNRNRRIARNTGFIPVAAESVRPLDLVNGRARLDLSTCIAQLHRAVFDGKIRRDKQEKTGDFHRTNTV